MALTSFGGTIRIPADADLLLQNATNTTFTNDATDEGVACIYRVPFNATIVALTVRFATVTTGSVLSVEVDTVTSASGLPSNTLYATGAAFNFSLTTTMTNSWQTISLSTAAAISVGDTLAFVVKQPTVAPGNFGLLALAVDALTGNSGATNTLSVWTKTPRIPCIFPVLSGTSGPVPAICPFNITAFSLSAAGAIDEVGNLIALPFPARISGFWVHFGGSSDVVAKVRLYDTDGSTIMSEQRVLAEMQIGSPLADVRIAHGFFPSSTALTANSNYRIAVFASAGRVNISALSFPDAASVALMNLGSACVATNRADGGAWSTNTKLRYGIGLLATALDDSSASGGAAGGLAHIIGGGL